MDINVHIIDTSEDLKELYKYLTAEYKGEKRVLALDVETNSSNAQAAELYGFGLTLDGKEAFYIVLKKHTGEYTDISKKELVFFLQELVARHKLIGHNYVYDYIVLLKNLGLDTVEFLHADTILMKHTVDEERPHGLKETAVKYLGDWADKAQEKLYASIEANGGSTNKNSIEMYKADTAILGEYCGWDVCLTYRLYEKFYKMLEEQNLFYLFFEDEVMPLYKEVTIPMTLHGFHLNIEHFKNLQTKIRIEISKLEDEIQETIAPLVEPICKELLDKDYPVKTTGNFPKVLAQIMGIELPTQPNGKVTLSKKILERTLDPAHPYTKWLFNGVSDPILEKRFLETQTQLFFNDNPEENYVFNLTSSDHLSKLLFDILGLEVLEETDTGKRKVDETTIKTYAEKHFWLEKLLDMKKLIKLESTYITGVLEREYNGVIYPSWLQFGTTSGRYSSMNINCQNLPRIKEEDSGLSELVLSYANQIKEGFIAPKGYKLIGADYSQLEPCAFACASGDSTLQEVFKNGYDLYSSIAIKTFKLEGYSADKKAPNYLGEHRVELRQKAKIIALAVVYGAGAGRLASILKTTVKEAQSIIDAYLDAYPQLRNYMESCDKQALEKGFVVSRFGRIRHIPKAKQLYKVFGPILLEPFMARKKGLGEQHWELKSILNLAKNHPIQSTAAYIVNKAAIAFSKEMKKRNLSGRIVAQVHDELTCIAKEEEAEEVSKILQECMEQTTKIEVPLRAKPVIADTWAEAK